MQSARESKGMHKAIGTAKRKQRDGEGDERDGNDRDHNGIGLMMCTT